MTTEVQAAAQEPRSSGAISRSLFAFAIFYGGMVCIAGVLGNKQVALGPLAVEAGIFAFLMLVITSSAVAELHGRDTANRLVLMGFVPLIFSILLTLLVLSLPASTDMKDLTGKAMEAAGGQGGALGAAAKLGTSITDMQEHLDALNKNMETLKEIKGMLGG